MKEVKAENEKLRKKLGQDAIEAEKAEADCDEIGKERNILLFLFILLFY